MLKFIDRHYPLFFGLILFALPVVAVSMSACSKTPEEKAAADARTLKWVKDELVTFSPRPGVECYVIRGSSSSSPRVMSCVVLPVTAGQ
mgnify:CR=1 FL=1